MHSKKDDSFNPKRATNIDGFIAKQPANRPRKPLFRQNPAKVQAQPATLANMPRRSTPQAVLSSSKHASPPALSRPTRGLDSPLSEKSTEPRRRQRPDGSPEQGKHKHPGRLKKIIKRSLLLFGAVVLLTGLWFGYKFYRNIAKITGNNNPLSLLSAFRPAHLKNQDGRVNVLVAGNSSDDAGHEGGNLTDSIMVLSVNTRDNTALMVSIPRDLWVYIPGVGHSKINAAYPNGGMDKLQTVVETNLGITIDYQALVNYTAFKDLVDAVGGITITIKSDDPRGIYDPSLDYTTRRCCALAKYPNGKVTLNGKQALNLSRARGDAYGSYGFPMADFDRTDNQRKMLLAIKAKASDSNLIANPFKITKLVDAVGNNVKTNLQLNEIQTLYSYMKKVDDSKIASYNINNLGGAGTTMLANYTSPSGQSALTPALGLDDFTDIQAQLLKLLSNDPLVRESASAVVLNATDTAGLARLQANKLKGKGIGVLDQANATVKQATTTIVDNSNGKKPETLAYLKKQFSATVVTDATLKATYPSADFILVVGENIAKQTSASQSTSQ